MPIHQISDPSTPTRSLILIHHIICLLGSINRRYEFQVAFTTSSEAIYRLYEASYGVAQVLNKCVYVNLYTTPVSIRLSGGLNHFNKYTKKFKEAPLQTQTISLTSFLLQWHSQSLGITSFLHLIGFFGVFVVSLLKRC